MGLARLLQIMNKSKSCLSYSFAGTLPSESKQSSYEADHGDFYSNNLSFQPHFGKLRRILHC